MLFTLLSLDIILLASLVLSLSGSPSYWPGESRGIPVGYTSHVITVVDTIDGNGWYRQNRNQAIREWNACGGAELSLGDLEPYSVNTITIFKDPPGGQEPAYGGWNGTAGIVALGGGWTRSTEVIAHEIGHALGFGHGGTGIMGGGHMVSAIDCEGLRHYY